MPRNDILRTLAQILNRGAILAQGLADGRSSEPTASDDAATIASREAELAMIVEALAGLKPGEAAAMISGSREIQPSMNPS